MGRTVRGGNRNHTPNVRPGSEGGAFGEKYKTEIDRSDRITGHCFGGIYVCTEWIDVK